MPTSPRLPRGACRARRTQSARPALCAAGSIPTPVRRPEALALARLALAGLAAADADRFDQRIGLAVALIDLRRAAADFRKAVALG